MSDFPIPIITGIGHEIDFTIADFVADFRAPTPSVAAETITPDSYELMQSLDESISRLVLFMQMRLTRNKEQLFQIGRNLNVLHPRQQFEQFKLRLKFTTQRLIGQQQNRINQHKVDLLSCQKGFIQNNPLIAIRQHQKDLEQLSGKNIQVAKQKILLSKHQLALKAKTLDTLSPLKTLSRGFATIEKDGKLVTSVKRLNKGDEVGITLRDGKKLASIL